MNDLSTPLSDEEYDRLDRFLLDRIDEEEDTLDKDEGVLDISELDDSAYAHLRLHRSHELAWT